MELVPSRYNLVIPRITDGEEKCLLYNTFSDSEALISSQLRNLLEGGNGLTPEQKSGLYFSYADDLLECGFMVESAQEENNSIREWFARKQTNCDELRVTILPTYACNLRCVYCFQSGLEQSSAKISSKVIIQIIDWIGERLDSIRPQQLSLTFFGGEPLLHRKDIIAMSTLITNEANRRGIYTSINLITNGTLLDQDFVNTMAPVGLKGAKVTIDGMPEFHDRLRCGDKGEGTFRAIVDNMLKNKDKLNFTVGSNYNSENVKSLPDLYDYLLDNGLVDSIAQVNFKPIFKGGKRSLCDTCTYSEIDPETHLRLIDEVEKRGLKTADWVSLGPCDFHRQYSYTIDPLGKIYKCEGLAGIEKAVIGTLDTPDIEEKAAAWMKKFDLFGQCGDCRYLPICGGGCRYWGYVKTGDFNGIACEKGYFETVAKKLILRRSEAIRATND